MLEFQLSKGRKQEPDFLVVYGVEGIGKTTFATDAEYPIIIDVEGGSAEIDTTRIESKELNCLSRIIDAIRFAADEPSIKTITIDSLSKVEEHVWDACCRRKSGNGKAYKNIEDFGFKQGYIFCLDEWDDFLNACEDARKKGKNVILIGHTRTKKFDDPTMAEGYTRYEIDIHDKASARIRKYVKAILFANYKTLVKDGKGLDTGVRSLFTERRPGHDAKNRYNLPYEINLSWKEYQAAKASAVMTPEKCLERLRPLVAQINDQEKVNQINALIESEKNVSVLQSYIERVEEIIHNQ